MENSIADRTPRRMPQPHRKLHSYFYDNFHSQSGIQFSCYFNQWTARPPCTSTERSRYQKSLKSYNETERSAFEQKLRNSISRKLLQDTEQAHVEEQRILDTVIQRIPLRPLIHVENGAGNMLNLNEHTCPYYRYYKQPGLLTSQRFAEELDMKERIHQRHIERFLQIIIAFAVSSGTAITAFSLFELFSNLQKLTPDIL